MLLSRLSAISSAQWEASARRKEFLKELDQQREAAQTMPPWDRRSRSKSAEKRQKDQQQWACATCGFNFNGYWLKSCSACGASWKPQQQGQRSRQPKDQKGGALTGNSADSQEENGGSSIASPSKKQMAALKSLARQAASLEIPGVSTALNAAIDTTQKAIYAELPPTAQIRYISVAMKRREQQVSTMQDKVALLLETIEKEQEKVAMLRLERSRLEAELPSLAETPSQKQMDFLMYCYRAGIDPVQAKELLQKDVGNALTEPLPTPQCHVAAMMPGLSAGVESGVAGSATGKDHPTALVHNPEDGSSLSQSSQPDMQAWSLKSQYSLVQTERRT